MLATGYQVYRGTTDNTAAATKLNTSAVTGVSYDDTTGVAGTTYYYWVIATGPAGSSPFSASDTGLRDPGARCRGRAQ